MFLLCLDYSDTITCSNLPPEFNVFIFATLNRLAAIVLRFESKRYQLEWNDFYWGM